MFHKSFGSSHRRRCVRGVFLGISRGSLGGACAGVSIFNRVAGLRPVTLLIGRLRRRSFTVGFAGFLEAPFLQSVSGRLLLLIPLSCPFLALCISPDNFLRKINNVSFGFNVLNFLQSKLTLNCGHLLN